MCEQLSEVALGQAFSRCQAGLRSHLKARLGWSTRLPAPSRGCCPEASAPHRGTSLAAARVVAATFPKARGQRMCDKAEAAGSFITKPRNDWVCVQSGERSYTAT